MSVSCPGVHGAGRLLPAVLGDSSAVLPRRRASRLRPTLQLRLRVRRRRRRKCACAAPAHAGIRQQRVVVAPATAGERQRVCAQRKDDAAAPAAAHDDSTMATVGRQRQAGETLVRREGVDQRPPSGATRRQAAIHGGVEEFGE